MKKMKKIKSIHLKFMYWIIPILSGLLITLGVSIFLQERNTQLQMIDDYSQQIVAARCDEITKWLEGIVNELYILAEKDMVQSMNWDRMKDDLSLIAKNRESDFGFLFAVFPDGYYYSTIKGKSTAHIRGKDYFEDIFVKGKDYSIANPYYSLTTGDLSTFVAVPIKRNGELVGVMCANVKIETLTQIAANIKIGKTGYGWIVDGKGDIIAHPNKDLILKLNVLNSDTAGFKNFKEAGEKMTQSRNGSTNITRPDEVEEYIVYHPIANSKNWTLGIAIEKEEIYSNINFLMYWITGIFILTIIIITVLILLFSKRIISNPIQQMTFAIEKVAKGSLFHKLQIKSNDEVGNMANSLSNMTEKLKSLVNTIKNAAENIAKGSREINSSAIQISQGSNEQAASSEQVSSSMEEMVGTINQNAENSTLAEKMATNIDNRIEVVNKSVTDTTLAMKTIAEKIKVINEIAEKTDLLAINAAIEAARAGEFGKGFSVVASEIRSLAENSNKAAIKIEEITINSVKTAELSNTLIQELTPELKKTTALVQEISAASKEQLTSANQVNDALQQLSLVIQQNSASSEELASTSEEFVQQAQNIRTEISFFKLKDIEGETVEELNKMLKKHTDEINIIKNKLQTDSFNENKENTTNELKEINKGVSINMTNEDTEYENY